MSPARENGGEADVKPARVLVVDDEPDVRELLQQILEDAGYSVESASDGAQAVLKVGESHPDLIVLDLMMPVMDGWEVLDQLRRDPPAPTVLILTAFTDEWRALRAGAWECLSKPFDRVQFLEACRRALASPRSHH